MTGCAHDFAGCGCESLDDAFEAHEFAQFDSDTEPSRLSMLRAAPDRHGANDRSPFPGRSREGSVARLHGRPPARRAAPTPDPLEAA